MRPVSSMSTSRRLSRRTASNQSQPTSTDSSISDREAANVARPCRWECLLSSTLGYDEELKLTSIKAIVRPGTVRIGHGLEISFSGIRCTDTEGRLPQASFDANVGYLDIHGDSAFSSLPDGIGLLAPLFLPLQIHLYSKHLSGDGKVFHSNFIIGAKQLSHGRIDSILCAMIEAGDKSFVFEFRGDDNSLWGYVVTKPSMIESSWRTQGGRDVSINGPAPPDVYKKTNIIFLAMKWAKSPALVMAWCWVLYLYPEMCAGIAIPLVMRSPAAAPAKLKDLLPLCPDSMAVAFRLGELKAALEAHLDQAVENSTVVESILTAAAALVGKNRSSVSAEQLLGTLAQIERVESDVSAITRVRGFFSFVNVMWFLAIVGICVSIGPSLYHLLHPLQQFLRRVAKWVFNNIISPTVRRLHSWQVIEMTMYAICACLISDGQRLDDDIGLFVTLTGAMLLIPVMFYTEKFWGLEIIAKQMHRNRVLQIYQCVLALCCIPLALIHSSTLIGYAVVLLLFSALGFGVSVSRLCLFIGFDSKSIMERCCLISFLLLSMFIGAKTVGINITYLEPFSPAIAVMGSNVFFLAMLIMSDGYYTNTPKRYRLLNIAMIFALVAFQLFGHLLGLASVANTSITYSVLYILQKYIYLHKSRDWNTWTLMLIISLVGWRASLHLHMHPEYITSLFSMS